MLQLIFAHYVKAQLSSNINWSLDSGEHMTVLTPHTDIIHTYMYLYTTHIHIAL